MKSTALQRAAMAGAILLVLAGGSFDAATAAPARQAATRVAYSCATAADVTGTQATAHAAMETTPMPVASPTAGMGMEFDMRYIDMMLPHHASIIALSQAAEDRLADPHLQRIAQHIIASQSAEIEELHQYRQRFFGNAEPPPMSHQAIAAMRQAMPNMGSMDEMANEMDAEAQVAVFCAAGNPDLAFIDLTIPHHEMAMAASEEAITHAIHPEIRAFAQGVIDAQQREIEELQAIRADLIGATPAATP